MKLKTKLVLIFLSISILPLAFLSFYNFLETRKALESSVSQSLETQSKAQRTTVARLFKAYQDDLDQLIMSLKTFQKESFKMLEVSSVNKIQRLEALIQGWHDFLASQASGQVSVQGIHIFRQYFDTQKKIEGYDRYYKIAHEQTKASGFEDYLLIDLDGTCVFSVLNGSEVGKNINHSAFDGTSLKKAWMEAKEKNNIAMADFEQYDSGIASYCAFIATPVIEPNSRKAVGYAVLRCPHKPIDHIVQNRDGLLPTSESYLVGEVNGKRTYRSNRVVKKGLAGTSRSGKDIEKGLSGQTGIMSKVGSTGDIEFAHYAPVKAHGLKWMLNTTASAEEILNPQVGNNSIGFLEDFMRKKGYYDLFLIEPNGIIFFSITHEADYRTNIINGKFRNSPLASAVNDAIKGKKYAFGDIALYEPSNYAPAAFQAMPLLNQNGDLEMIVALQIDINQINSIAHAVSQIEQGMETYFVGSDRRMRSDSLLNPEEYSVAASFTKDHHVKTIPVSEGLNGKNGFFRGDNYLNDQSLTVYTPIELGSTRWVMVSDMNEKIAFASLEKTKKATLVVIVVLVVIISILGFFFANSITGRLLPAYSLLKNVASGNLNGNINVKGNDEIAQIGLAANTMVSDLRKMINTLVQNSHELTAASKELSATSIQLESNARETTVDANRVIESGHDLDSSIKDVLSITQDLNLQAQSVVASAEEISSSSKEISHSCERGTETAKNCLDKAKKAAQGIDELANMANSIGEVVSIIKEIADQTNLLALNATIEAASAGEAGKGFAVVANEVKALSRQTAEATGRIGKQILSIQSSVKHAIDSIRDIHTIAEEQNLISATIAQTVNHQNQATDEITKSIVRVSQNTQETLKKINHSQSEVQSIQTKMGEVNQVIHQVSAGASQIKSSSLELDKMSADLKEMITRFTL